MQVTNNLFIKSDHWLKRCFHLFKIISFIKIIKRHVPVKKIISKAWIYLLEASFSVFLLQDTVFSLMVTQRTSMPPLVPLNTSQKIHQLYLIYLWEKDLQRHLDTLLEVKQLTFCKSCVITQMLTPVVDVIPQACTPVAICILFVWTFTESDCWPMLLKLVYVDPFDYLHQ